MLSRLLFHKFTALSVLLIPLTAALGAPDEVRQVHQPAARIKAVQVPLLEGSDMEDLPAQLRSWKDAGFDTVILRAFHVAGDRPHGPAVNLAGESSQGVYFETGQAPVIMDLMSPFAAMCHQAGLKAFAWMVTKDARFDNARLPTETVYDPSSGKTRPVPRLDIMDPAVLDYLELLFADLARSGIDGILLQDDLNSRMLEGFSRGNVRRYQQDTGDATEPYRYLKHHTDEDGTSHLRAADGFDSWILWKTHRLVYVARRLQDAVDKTVPGTILVMNQMYETLTDPANGRLWLSQDLTVSLREGPPYTALMLYFNQMQEELDIGLAEALDLVGRSLDALSAMVAPSRVILKFQTMDWSTGKEVSTAELLSVLTTVRDNEWSLAFFPPPTEKQLEAISPVLGGM